jgi:lysophospholipase L1-like esterase
MSRSTYGLYQRVPFGAHKARVNKIGGAVVKSIDVIGLNLWDEETESGYISDSGVLIDDASSLRSKNYMPITPSTYYTIVNSHGSGNFTVVFYDESYNAIDAKGMTYPSRVIYTSSAAKWFKFSLNGYGEAYSYDISMNDGNDDATYHKYITASIAIPNTVINFEGYGQHNSDNTVYNYIDFDNMVYVEKGYISNGTWVSKDDEIDVSEYFKDYCELNVSGCSKLLFKQLDNAESPAFCEAIYLRNISKKWLGAKWTCVGDSLTEVNRRSSKRYHDYVSEETGIKIHNMGVGGTGYASGIGNNSIYDRIVNVPLDSDVVTIFGSGNDLGTGVSLGDIDDTSTDNTLCGYINSTIDRLFNLYPLVKLGIVTPTPWEQYPPTIEDNAMELYSNAIVNICKRRGIPCLDLYHCSGLRPWEETFRTLAYSKDYGAGTHPDEVGHSIIAPRFKDFLETLLM